MSIPFQDLSTCRRAVDWRREVRMTLGWLLRLLEGRLVAAANAADARAPNPTALSQFDSHRTVREVLDAVSVDPRRKSEATRTLRCGSGQSGKHVVGGLK